MGVRKSEGVCVNGIDLAINSCTLALPQLPLDSTVFENEPGKGDIKNLILCYRYGQYSRPNPTGDNKKVSLRQCRCMGYVKNFIWPNMC